MSDLKELVESVTDLGTPTTTGSTSGLYVLFSKWKEDVTWGFTQSYTTKEGVRYMMNTVNEELLTKIDMKLMFADAQTETLNQVFNTMEIQHETAS